MLPDLNGFNKSILAIPVHFIISMMPYAVARVIATRGRLPIQNIGNLRAQDTRAQLEQRVPAESYARYMRTRGCYHSGMEIFPLFVAAVVVGNMAGLPQDMLNTFAVSSVAFRAACTMSCLLTVTSEALYVRGGLWVMGVWMCLVIFVEAAVAMSDGKTKEVHRVM